MGVPNSRWRQLLRTASVLLALASLSYAGWSIWQESLPQAELLIGRDPVEARKNLRRPLRQGEPMTVIVAFEEPFRRPQPFDVQLYSGHGRAGRLSRMWNLVAPAGQEDVYLNVDDVRETVGPRAGAYELRCLLDGRMVHRAAFLVVPR
jgi:hypothetical protein